MHRGIPMLWKCDKCCWNPQGVDVEMIGPCADWMPLEACHESYWVNPLPSGKLTWLAGKPPFLLADTSSHAGFSSQLC